jgi:hypothetical protein
MREEEIKTDPAPPMEPTMTDLMSVLQVTQRMMGETLSSVCALQEALQMNADAIVQLKNRVLELHQSASQDVGAVRSRLSVVEHRLGLTPAPHATGGNGSA